MAEKHCAQTRSANQSRNAKLQFQLVQELAGQTPRRLPSSPSPLSETGGECAAVLPPTWMRVSDRGCRAMQRCSDGATERRNDGARRDAPMKRCGRAFSPTRDGCHPERRFAAKDLCNLPVQSAPLQVVLDPSADKERPLQGREKSR